MPLPKVRFRTLLFIIFAIVLLGLASFSEAAKPQHALSVAELQANQSISEAEVAQATAELKLAKWKFGQLKKLHGRGHATWQEFATQQNKVVSVQAKLDAAIEHRNFLKNLAALLGTTAENTKDTESIPLFVPGSSRLVGWINAEQANSELLQRQLKNLRHELATVESLDPTSLKKKAKAAELRALHKTASHPLKQRDLANAELASANQGLASAHVSLGEVLRRRITIIENVLGQRTDIEEGLLAIVGTPFMSCRQSDDLAEVTREATSLERAANQPASLLRQLAKMQSDRVASLEQLSRYPSADFAELEHAKTRLNELHVAIATQKSIDALKQKLATFSDKGSADSQLESPFEFNSNDTAIFADASILRHLIELHRKRASLFAAKNSSVADVSYLRERLRKIQAIPAEHRAPHELELAEQKLKLANGRVLMIKQSLAALNGEALRVVAQFEAQQIGKYEIVQGKGNTFIPRALLAKQEAIISTVGFVGSLPSESCNYIESPAVFRLLSSLTTTIQPQSKTIPTISEVSSTRPNANSAVFKNLPTTRSIQLATDGITYPSDLFNYVPSDLWQVYPGYRGYGYVPLTYLRGAGSTVSRGQSLGYSSTNLKAGPFDRSNFYAGVNPPGAVTKFYSQIPRYRDFYSFGIRRYDGPAGSNFRRGVRAYSPFYLPGLPTNFRY